MKALIDADILLYEIGSYTDDEGHPLPWPLLKSRADAKILKIQESAGCDSYHLYLTGKNNFRISEGTILPYKGQRVSPKPHGYAKLKEYFLGSNNFRGKRTLAEDWEADDQLAIDQCANIKWSVTVDEEAKTFFTTAEEGSTVLCSRDKDLAMVPGMHYSWPSGKQKEKEPYYVSVYDGLKKFYTQLLTGDMTDNIKGLYKVGPVAAKAALKGLETDLELYIKCQQMYEDRFSSYWELFLHENARLLWMMRNPTDDIRVELRRLEDERLRLISDSLERVSSSF